MAANWCCRHCVFLITNSDKIIPLLSKQGFLVCGGLLCVSCFFGVLAKLAALRSQIASQINLAVQKTFKEHLAKYEDEEEEIQEGAKFWGINLQTGVRLGRILSEFSKPLPWSVKLLMKWKLKGQEKNPQVGYLPLINNLTWLGYLTAGQSLTFLAFLVAGFVYAAAI